MKKIIHYLNSKVVAVTGGMGSGQSTVCDYLKDFGCKIINVDQKAKQIIQKDISLQKELKNSPVFWLKSAILEVKWVL